MILAEIKYDTDCTYILIDIFTAFEGFRSFKLFFINLLQHFQIRPYSVSAPFISFAEGIPVMINKLVGGSAYAIRR